MTDELTNAPGAPLGDHIGQQRREEPTHASLSGLWHFLAAAIRQVRPYWKEMSVVVMASIPQVALETAQPMLLMVLINAIVAHDNARVWAAVLGLVGLIPIYITGNFLFEYMASGLPVITIGRPPLDTIVRPGLEGLHVREGDAADLARAIGALADDAPARARMGRSGRERVVERYSWARHCEQLEGVLRRIGA